MKKIVILLSVILLFIGCTTEYKNFIAKDEIKEKTKEYTLQTLKGETIKIKGSRNLLDIQGGGLEGQVILVDFWATWCPFCKNDIPHFIEMVNKHKGKFNVIGVLIKEDKDKQTIQKFVDGFKINYPVTIGKDNDSFAKDLMPKDYVPFLILYDNQ